MTNLRLSKTSLISGKWQGALKGVDGEVVPSIRVTLNDTVVATLDPVKASAGDHWIVEFDIPAHHLSDGVQTYLFTAEDKPEVLNSLAILSGDAASDDMRAEMELLRAELDMLKRAFRRHCVESH